MANINWQAASRRAVLAMVLCVSALVAPVGAEPGNDNRAPDLGDYTDLRVEAGHKVAFYAYAEGVQIYIWSGSSWVFSRPEAVLYSEAEDGDLIGMHYVGPTWETISGSFVKGAVEKKVTVEASAVQWLLLKATESGGPGVLNGVTYIQRVNTAGGLAPADPGVTIGEEARIPYTADYYFYRKHD